MSKIKNLYIEINSIYNKIKIEYSLGNVDNVKNLADRFYELYNELVNSIDDIKILYNVNIMRVFVDKILEKMEINKEVRVENKEETKVESNDKNDTVEKDEESKEVEYNEVTKPIEEDGTNSGNILSEIAQLYHKIADLYNTKKSVENILLDENILLLKIIMLKNELANKEK